MATGLLLVAFFVCGRFYGARWADGGARGRKGGRKAKKGQRRGVEERKEGERSGNAGVWACFGAIFGARGGFDGVQLHDAQGWAFKWCINSV